MNNRPLSKKCQKTKNLPKPQFLQWFLKVGACKICSKMMIFAPNMLSRIVLNSGSVFFRIFVSFGPLLVSFWQLFGPLLVSWDDFGRLLEILGIVWLQLRALGCNLVALGSHFGFRNLPWLVFGRKLPKKWAVPLCFSKMALKSERIVRE